MDYLSISVETDVVEKNVTLYCGKVTKVSALVAEVSPWQNYVSKICRHKNGPRGPLSPLVALVKLAKLHS